MSTRSNESSSRFKPGHKPHNAGKSWDEWLSKEAQEAIIEKSVFQKGHIPQTQRAKGTVTRHERVRKDGTHEVMYTINIDWKGRRHTKYSYKRYLWEIQNQRDLPEGYVLWAINGDQDDIRIENLELISRGELVRRNKGE